MRFTHELGDGYALALRTLDTAEEMHALTMANLDRLRRWEQWALYEQSLEATTAFTQAQLASYVSGDVLPTVLLRGEVMIGSVSLRMDHAARTAEIGYWVDAAAEGRGAVTRACSALLREADARGIRRVEIRTTVDNVRSLRVAERLGFQRDAVLASAMPHGDERRDLAVYARVTDG
ncbi:GNAT family N-acetyltransferase [Arenivirga flava]|uniref:Ribosomal protein L7/L12-serine acetyltransferase n=1 Tax=Arenivirga flava TaxID=1930060 RepID=A0AA37UUW5_9MICO|nr:GNAT family N-acetyltransferase [Arenivirga flava]GMA28927.1 ribosomal protein L7/L12-serine acetyltransferase [Arenivirga flava]